MPQSPASSVWRHPTRYYIDLVGLVHDWNSGEGANAVMRCECANRPYRASMRALTEVFDRPVTCLRCLAAT